MFIHKIVPRLRLLAPCKNLASTTCFRTINTAEVRFCKNEKNDKILGDMGSKYQIFDDKDAEEVLDIYEERLKYTQLLEENEQEEQDRYAGLNLERNYFAQFLNSK